MPGARTETIEHDGESWTIRNRITHGAEVAVEEVTNQWLTIPDPKIGPNGTITGEAVFDFDKWDSYAADDALLLAQTAEWTYGPVNAENLKNVDGEHRAMVLEVLNRIVAASPLARRREAKAKKLADD